MNEGRGGRPDAVFAQELKSPIWGGSGGTKSYNLDCGRNAVLVGLVGKWESWIDQLGALCRQVDSSGRLGGEFTRGPVGGQGGTVSGARRCASGGVVVGLRGRSGWDE